MDRPQDEQLQTYAAGRKRNRDEAATTDEEATSGRLELAKRLKTHKKTRNQRRWVMKMKRRALGWLFNGGLPAEIMQMIFRYLPVEDAVCAAHVCSYWRANIIELRQQHWRSQYQALWLRTPPLVKDAEASYWITIAYERRRILELNKPRPSALIEESKQDLVEQAGKFKVTCPPVVTLKIYLLLKKRFFYRKVVKKTQKQRGITYWFCEAVCYSFITDQPIYISYEMKKKKRNDPIYLFYWGFQPKETVERSSLRKTELSPEDGKQAFHNLVVQIAGNRNVVKHSLLGRGFQWFFAWAFRPAAQMTIKGFFTDDPWMPTCLPETDN